ncbi:MAG: MBL fold metallo-hydrolase [Clostridia bacterium]|nr:MBL fold metallo-hydrolase [Clostridia bacterium]
MVSQFRITHYFHSGFSIEADDLFFVFDYWRGERQELTGSRQILPSQLSRYRKVFVFISHEHIDHLDPIVFTWKEQADVSYFVSSDMPVGTRGKRMAPGDSLTLDPGITVTAFESTDLGVSFLLNIHGRTFFHAGDLNFWHWRDESTLQEIDEAEQEFVRAVKPLSREQVDVAFFPVDPRQGTMFEAGANYFILQVKPRLLIPMHYFHRTEIILEYARTASSRTTEVLAMPGIGDCILLDFDEDGYMNISFPVKETPPAEAEEVTLDTMEDSPFAESDLPLPQLAEPESQLPQSGEEETSE